MPYDSNGTGFNRSSYTSWLASKQIASKAPSQRLKILGLFATGHGVFREGIPGLTSWHVKTHLAEMFANGKTTSWTARLADMVAKGDLCKLPDQTWRDPDGVLRDLYFRAEDVARLPETLQAELF